MERPRREKERREKEEREGDGDDKGGRGGGRRREETIEGEEGGDRVVSCPDSTISQAGELS